MLVRNLHAEGGEGSEAGFDQQWGRQPIDELEGSALEWSTIEEMAGRAKTVRAKRCLFCGHTYLGGPLNIRQHLDRLLPHRNVRACKPIAQWVDRHAAVLQELRLRAQHASN